MGPDRSSARALLAAACLARKSGELVVRGADAEIRVFLRAGRVAWGASSADALGFAQRLRATCGVSPIRFAKVVAECKREGLSLNVGLQRHGLATPRQTLEAIHAHTSQVVAALELVQQARAQFVERREFDDYDARFTFGLEELAEAGQRASAGARVGSVACLAQVMRELPTCSWSECWGAGGLTERLSRGSNASAPEALRSLLDGSPADLVAIQHGIDALFGVKAPEGALSLWAGVSGKTSLGAACAILLQAAGVPPHGGQRPAATSVCPPKALEDGAPQVAATATELMLRAPDVCGVCHLVGGRVSSLIVRDLAKSPVLPERLLRFAEHAFSPEVCPAQRAAAAMRSAVIGQETTWSFGAELSGSTEESIWVVTQRAATLGFGWACVTSVLKRLEAA